jgi:UDP-N-acetyl-2-amino-2-deoxyglucuronate dehydrogenase
MQETSSIIQNRAIRIAVVGCGRISANHFSALRQLDGDLELVAVCDSNSKVLDGAVRDTGARGYKNLTDLLAKSNADVVTLCTPSGLHARQSIECAKAGRHVITEKPMATRWKDGLRMVEAFDESGTRLFVVKQNRLNPTIQLLKRAIDLERFGRIYMVAVNVFWTRPQMYYDSADWRGTWEFDGGALMNQASHYVDLLDWLIGPIDSVQAMTGTLARNIEVDDTAVLNVRWRSGTLGSMSVTMLTHNKNFEASITILGEKGTVRVGGLAINEIQHWEFAEPHQDDVAVKNSNYQTSSVYGIGHPLYYANVVKALRGECEAQTDGREGLRSLELLTAAYLSSRSGSRVSLPLEF